MKLKQRQLALITLLAVLEAASLTLALGWFRQLGPAGLTRSMRFERGHINLPPGFTLAPSRWPARLKYVTSAQALSGWHQFRVNYRVSIFGHVVFLPQGIHKLALWGRVRPGSSLTLALKFRGHGRRGGFRIPIQMERVKLQIPTIYGNRAPLSLPAGYLEQPTVYGDPDSGGLVVSWMHHLRISPKANAEAALTTVKPFQICLPKWAKTIRLSWGAQKAPGEPMPRIGFTATSGGRQLVISASWDWANQGRITIKPHSTGSFEGTMKTLRRAGCPPWLLARTVQRGLSLLHEVSPEDILRLSLGINPRRWQPQTNGELQIAKVVAASTVAEGLDVHSVDTLFCEPVAAGRLYYCVRPEVSLNGKAEVEGQGFYFFGPSGDLACGGYIVVPKNLSGHRGIGLAAGALGLLTDRP
jgi:hypothetical protein